MAMQQLVICALGMTTQKLTRPTEGYPATCKGADPNVYAQPFSQCVGQNYGPLQCCDPSQTCQKIEPYDGFTSTCRPRVEPETLCFSASINTSPNQLNRIEGTGTSLTNESLFASGEATVSWVRGSNDYSLSLDSLNYPPAYPCTAAQIATGNAAGSCNPVIASHLHSGGPLINGPASVIFCMGPGLPSHTMIPGSTFRNCPPFSANQPWVLRNMQWNGNVVNATTEPGTENDPIADGGPTFSATQFGTLMEDCYQDAANCLVYLNIHTNYSLTRTNGLGLASAQLVPKECPVYSQ